MYFSITKGDAKGIEILVHLSPAGEPVVGQTKSSEYTLEKFFNSVIHYHNTLTNEAPVKSVCIYFYETVDVTVVTETVALLKRKENEVINAEKNSFDLQFKVPIYSSDQFSGMATSFTVRW